MKHSNHMPKKRFGQHFLRDQNIIQRIVAAINPLRGQHLVEIGPGQGAITLPVLRKCHCLEVVEFDRDLLPELEDRTAGCGQLIIHSADVLDFDFARIRQDDQPLRVFGNLPYNISTPLIFHLLSYASIISDMVFMLQKEVADRLAAPCGSSAYGRLSVMVQYHCQVDLLFDVAPAAFHPPPQVQSSIVRLIPYKQYPVVAKDYELFADIVRHAFGQRRKTLRNSLKGIVDDAAWQQITVGSDLRAEKLSVKDFVEIANVLAK